MSEDKPELLQQLFGPLFSLMGPDLEEVYKFTREKLLAAYTRKVGKSDDEQKINPRIAYDALTSAAFTGTDVAAEYFMGALASSRTPDGKDDSVIRFVATMKAMSSSQLRLHYCIYRALNKILVRAGRKVQLGIAQETQQLNVFFFRTELMGDVHSDLIALHNQGLLLAYETQGISARPSSLCFGDTNSLRHSTFCGSPQSTLPLGRLRWSRLWGLRGAFAPSFRTYPRRAVCT